MRQEGKYFGFAMILITMGLFFAGCAETNLEQGIIRLESPDVSKSLPKYQEGTVFVYGNGAWDRVDSIENGLVSWQNHRGNGVTAAKDFTFRPIQWESTRSTGTRSFRKADFLFSDLPVSIWPLRVGNKAAYIEENLWQPKGGIQRDYSAYWSCKVVGKEQVRVPAGSFATWKIECGRYSSSMKSSTAFPREFKTWYYAPEISHWVVYERERKRRDDRLVKRLELVAVLPALDRLGLGEKGRGSMQRFYQDVLEKQPSGKAAEWKTRDGSILMTVTPVQTFRRKNKMICRQYSQLLTINGNTDSYYGVACRNPKGKWSVPRRGK